jgi:DNA-binding NarL/FixJ family response regulator
MQSTSPDRGVRIMLADDHALVREAFRTLLECIAGVKVVGEASTGDELVQLVARDCPDMVFTDLTMPGLDGIGAIGQLRALHPHLPVVVLSMHDEIDVIKRAVAKGASGYLLKQAPQGELELAVRSVLRDGRYFSPMISGKLLRREGDGADEALTPRQKEILKLVALGMSSRQIGAELGLSSKTVDVHRSRIMDRLDIRDVAGLTRYAIQKGLLLASSHLASGPAQGS